MITQQIGQDYYLFFSREGERYIGFPGSGSLNLKLTGGELTDRPKVLEAVLRDINGRPLDRKVRMITRENSSEVGIEPRFTPEGDLEILFGNKAYEHFNIFNDMSVPLPSGDGVVRINYHRLPPAMMW